MRKGEEFIVCNCVLYSIKLQLLTISITVGYLWRRGVFG